MNYTSLFGIFCCLITRGFVYCLIWMSVILFHIPSSSCDLSVSRNDTRAEPGLSCSEEMASQVLINITSSLRYDRRIRPNYGGKAVDVNISYFILGFREIHEVDMTYVVDMYFRQKWLDERLRHSLNCSLTFLTGTKHPADFIWVADTTFENSVKSFMHNVVTNNHVVFIYSDGTVRWGTRVTVKAYCPMKLSSYPFDVQVCPLTLVSYNYLVNHVQYAWEYDPGVNIQDKELAQFIVTDIKTNGKNVNYALGVYSTLNAYFTFKRRLGYYVIQIFTPCMFLVVLAGFSFWMDPRATPARVALSLTTLLTTATIWSSINSSMPKVSYVKAIDVFFLTSFGFVFSTLLQYILLLTLKVNLNSRKALRDGDKNIVPMKVLRQLHGNPISVQSVKQRTCFSNQSYSGGDFLNDGDRMLAEKYGIIKGGATPCNTDTIAFDQEALSYGKRENEEFECVVWIDRLSRIGYPLCYLIFNLIFWFKYYS